MQQLDIKNIEVHAYHGCLPEEAKIGSLFAVDVSFEGDFSAAMSNDDLSKAVDYVIVHRIVREQMAIRSNLIEHVAARLLKHLRAAFPAVAQCKVSITKFNPPWNGSLVKSVFTVEA